MIEPNAVLGELRQLIQDVYDLEDDPEVLANALADKLRDLDEHITNGGELPDDWQP